MCIDYHDKFLFSAGNDGSLIIYQINDTQGSLQEKDDGLNIVPV